MLSVVVEWPTGRASKRLGEDECRVGSAPDNDLVVDSSFVSRHHAVLRVVQDMVEVRDLDSRNGTVVNGRLVRLERVPPPLTIAFGPGVSGLVQRVESDEFDLHPAVAVESVPTGTVRPEVPTTPGWSAASRAQAPRVAEALLDALAGADACTVWDAVAATAAKCCDLTDVFIVDVASGEATYLAGSAEIAARHHSSLLALASARSAEDSAGGPHDWTATAPAWHALARDGQRCTVLVGFGAEPDIPSQLDAISSALAIASRVAGRSPLRRDAAPAPAFSISLPDRPIVACRSPAILRLHELAAGAISSDLPVLLTGETGVGKEVYARAIHLGSRRHDGPLRSVNSSAIPEDLLESLLFGAEEGVATGVRRQKGLLREADRGTFFFDEIGDMSPRLQAKILRVLDDRSVLPVGGASPVPVDVRFIAATNRDLRDAIRAGAFREDLYQRLRGHELRIPALRERPEDIPAHVAAFLRDEAGRAGRPAPGITVKAMGLLLEHDWPGNVRELETLMRRLVHDVGRAGRPIGHEDLPEDVRGAASPRGSLEERLDGHRRRIVRAALDAAGGNKSRAAVALGIGRVRLRELLRRLDMDDVIHD